MSEELEGKAKPNKKSNLVLKILLIAFLIIALCSGGFLLFQQWQVNRAAQDLANTPIPEPEPTLENPIDFAALQAQNPDIYAWLYVPDTNINYPVLQHGSDDFYYLNYNVNHERSIEGAIYTELVNSKDFSDPVTVIYGHNIRSGLMFATLHDFEDPAFFEEHPYFYIYTPGHILTYKIVAAAGYDDRHIINTNDFSDAAALEAYLASITAQDGAQKNVRPDSELTINDRIVQLSTCNYTYGNERYVLTGVLVEDQRTK